MEKSAVSSLQERLNHEIPIAQAMGVKVLETDREHVRLFAPLVQNMNHKSTAFGGSVNAVAVLSCWALLSQTLKGTALAVDYVVVQDSRIDYQLPISSDFEAVSEWQNLESRDKFFSILERKGLARITLVSEVRSQGKVCARFEGRFVAQTRKS